MASRSRSAREEDPEQQEDAPAPADHAHVSNRSVIRAMSSQPKEALPFRSEMEAAFGAELSDVGVTTGSRQPLRSIDATAATRGNQVQFADAHPRKETVAHEVAHVLQNRAGGTVTHPISDPSSDSELEATARATDAAAGRRVDVREHADAAVHRELMDELARLAAQGMHILQQLRVYSIISRGLATSPDPAKGIYDVDNLLHNSAEWIKHNNCSFIVLTPIHDSGTRNPPQIGYFDLLTQWPAGGGTYPADPTVVNDPHIHYADAGDIGGMASGGGRLTVIDPASQSDALLQETIIHEVQHDADQTWPGQRWADPAGSAYNDYQSEFRAYWIESGEGSPQDQFGSSADPAVNSRQVSFTDPASGVTTTVPTAFSNLRQEDIFWHLVDTGYGYVPQNYVQVPAFKTMVDEMVSPVGGNLVNSVRIQTLSEQLDACDSSMGPADPAVQAMFQAADALDALDRRYLQDDEISVAFWTQAQGRLSAEVYDMLHNTVWFGTRQPWGDFPVPEGDTSFA